ncbi:MAG: YihA family ribosome biogenesis GTP-binding protein [Acidobacteria bacterium]|nr:MAG: YihA family ribosome biogenesis GTP-binding protein [Acidobacteriota bacterium]REK01262.1 MAG: YihA family ribosome biogenesis GTP-binding protein [Acidobacteriota bacterium]REK14218.1 MAG: YihA family ribosome biogenesis GTP-binding protein [Acidobacteriota bacterium]REK44933.1 MAG: YihA family ribosome biogenesis GTP-binding protein [Acidobacteriota bacterium]
MKISSAEFIKSAFEESHWVSGELPEVSFLGRSNVGKSSLLNSLLERKKLAKTSNTPGRTQAINFFLINDRFYFVDLPGYGFAKVPKKMREDWGKMAEDYLAKRKQLVLSIQLVDARHSPTALDRQLYAWLTFHRKNSLVVATKADKLSNNKLNKSLDDIRRQMPDCKVLPYSSVTGKGREEVWGQIINAVG